MRYTRDAFGRIAAVTLQAQGCDDGQRRDDNDARNKTTGKTIVSGVTYAPFGPVTGLTFGNGIASRLTYDQDYRLTGIAAQGRATVQSLTQVYDGVNDITSITDFAVRDRDHDNAGHSSQGFTYDADYRLLTATGLYGAESFAYDADGNRIGEAATFGQETRTSTYTYAATSNQLLRVAVGSDHVLNYTYAANGDTATVAGGREAQTFTYDSRNRNSAIYTRDNEHGDGSGKYLYNALGERAAKDNDGNGHEFSRQGNTHFIYDEQGNLIAEVDGSRGVAKDYIYMDALPIAELDGGNTYYIHTDQLGTPQKMTDDRQQIVWDRLSDPFGETLNITGPATINLRFPGQYHDAESGLDYNFSRSYNAHTGRYTQSDPVGLLGGVNTYGYAGANPINGTDRFGLLFPQVGPMSTASGSVQPSSSGNSSNSSTGVCNANAGNNSTADTPPTTAQPVKLNCQEAYQLCLGQSGTRGSAGWCWNMLDLCEKAGGAIFGPGIGGGN